MIIIKYDQLFKTNIIVFRLKLVRCSSSILATKQQRLQQIEY